MPWKESLILAIEEQFAFGYLNVPKTYTNFQKFRIDVNPYRIDEQGFEGTVLSMSHLHQTGIIFMVGIFVTFNIFVFELAWLVFGPRRIKDKK